MLATENEENCTVTEAPETEAAAEESVTEAPVTETVTETEETAAEAPEVNPETEAATEKKGFTDKLKAKIEKIDLSKFKTKKFKKSLIIAAAAIVFAVLFFTLLLPLIKYSVAQSAFEKGDYEKADAIFTKLEDYKESESMVKQCELGKHYAAGVAFLEESKPCDAISEFKAANDFKDSAELLIRAYYEYGKERLAAKDYGTAIDELTLAGSYEDAAALLKTAYYEYGMKVVDSDYAKAREMFTAAKGEGDSEKMLTVCDFLEAEDYMKQGHLNTAKKIYESLPEDFSYKNVSAAERLALLEKNSRFVAICGTYKCTTLEMVTKQTHRTGIWHSWTGERGPFTAEVTCVINEDETVTVSATVNYRVYSNYSSLSYNVDETNLDIDFDYTGTSLGTINNDGTNLFGNKLTRSISFSGDSMKFSHRRVDNNTSVNFTYTYTANGTYTLVEAW